MTKELRGTFTPEENWRVSKAYKFSSGSNFYKVQLANRNHRNMFNMCLRSFYLKKESSSDNVFVSWHS